MTDWIVCPEKKDAAAKRLFCFPFAGRGASAYRTWIEETGADLELCLIQYPGRENRLRERPFTRVGALVSALADGISDWLDRPFAFYGHSLGGKIAFETLRELRRRGVRLPSTLFVGASQGPRLAPMFPLLNALPENEFVEAIQNRYGAVPRQILADPELRALLIPSVRADIELLETYVYAEEPPLDCDILAFGGKADPTIDRSELEAWQQETRGGFALKILDAGHFFLQPARRELLGAIEAQLSLRPLAVSESL